MTCRGPLGAPHEPPAGPSAAPPHSDRTAGLMLAAGITVLTMVRPLIHGRPPWWPGGLAAIGLVVIALARPRLLAPLHLVWYRVIRAVQSALSTIVMALLFFGCVTPLALVMRWRGRPSLRLDRDPTVSSYWIHREPPASTANHFQNPF